MSFNSTILNYVEMFTQPYRSQHKLFGNIISKKDQSFQANNLLAQDIPVQAICKEFWCENPNISYVINPRRQC